AGDDEAVAVDVVGAAGRGRGVVELGRHRAHRVEQAGEGPVQLLAAAGEDYVLPPKGDLARADAYAVGRGGAGRGDREVEALDLEPGRQRRRRPRTHRLGHRG